MEMTHIINWLVILSMLYILAVNVVMLRRLRAWAFGWMIAGILYGIAIRLWIEIDAWTPRALYPQTQWGVAIMGGMYLGLAMGFYGLYKGLELTRRRAERKYGRRKGDIQT